MEKISHPVEDQLYIASLILLFSVKPCVRLLQELRLRVPFLFQPCIFRTLTGYYCPGCGGTRAVSALMHGHVLLSVLYHPVVLYATAIILWFTISQTIERLSGGRIPIGLGYHDGFLIAGLALLGCNYVIKLGAQFLFQVNLLELLDVTCGLRFG